MMDSSTSRAAAGTGSEASLATGAATGATAGGAAYLLGYLITYVTQGDRNRGRDCPGINFLRRPVRR